MKVDIFNTDKKYQIIYADPAWKYNFGKTSRDFVNNKYTVMDKQAICELPIHKLTDARKSSVCATIYAVWSSRATLGKPKPRGLENSYTKRCTGGKKMREKLIELIREADKICDSQKRCEGCVGFGNGNDCVGYLEADYLFKNGVVVLPCKIDDKVFVIPTEENGRKEITLMTCLGFMIGKPCNTANCVDEKNKLYQPSFDKFGKTVFLTKKEAETALEAHNATP